MAWIATAGEPRYDNDIVRIEVLLMNDDTTKAHTVKKDFVLGSPEDFAQLPVRVGVYRDQIAKLYDAAAAFVPGPITIPDPPDTSAQEAQLAFEVARKAWLVKQKEFTQADLTGVKQEDIDAAYATMKSLWKPEYGAIL